MSRDIYAQIVDLKNQTDDVKRGRDFEVLIREIQPWDHRPPIVSSQQSEQLDGVFIYKNTTYIIESKAVKKTITPGMHEWEDFELKLQRRRDKRVVGMFCCLFDVSDTVITRARELNMVGTQTIVIAGKTWDELAAAGIYFPSFLDYMMLQATLKNSPSIDSITNAKSWIYDGESINNNFINNTRKISSTFLRRFKHKYHEKLFVPRSIDIQIGNFIRALAPQSLKAKKEAKSKDSTKQIIIVRDFSGSGKTTLSINMAATSENAFCFATTANLNLVDNVLDDFLSLNKYPNYGINELLAVNKPFLFIIDSLDETPYQQYVHKRQEIKSLLKKLEELNIIAQSSKLQLFPIALMFTVREEYWRDWEASFEGRLEVIQLKKLLSNFSANEFPTALRNYAEAYNYSISNNLGREAIEILSVPINLEIFSEANHYEGEIAVDDIWEGKILSSYFSKKEEALTKHYIDRFASGAFYGLLCALAYRMLTDKTTLFSKHIFNETTLGISQDFSFHSEQLLLNLISEQIIINDIDDVNNYRFKYVRFIEYLVALHIIRQVDHYGDFTIVDKSIQTIYDSNIVSIYSVLTNIKHICRTQYKNIESAIIEYYSHSETFLNKYLPELRGQIARGEKIPEEIIKSIVTNNFIQSSTTSWDMFFILSAKNLDEKKDTILSSFVLAWQTNKKHANRWKLINKLTSRNFLIEEKVIYAILKDGSAREWEEYLGGILTSNENDLFLDTWTQINGQAIFNKSVEKDPTEWQYANRLLDIIYNEESFIPGDIFAKQSAKKYVVFEQSHAKKLPVLDSRTKDICDEFLHDFNELFAGNATKPYIPGLQLKDLNKEAFTYINIKLEPLYNGRYSFNELPFINYVISQTPETNMLLRVISETSNLDIPLSETDKNNRTLFIEVLECDHDNKLFVLELIFRRGYKKTSYDIEYVNKAITENQQFNAKEFESILMGYAFLKINKIPDYPKIQLIHRELCVLFSAKYNRIINFKFPNFLQVANTAIEHYKEFTTLLIRGFEIYGKKNELESKPSYLKKVGILDQNKIPQSHEFDNIFEAIFPELYQ